MRVSNESQSCTSFARTRLILSTDLYVQKSRPYAISKHDRLGQRSAYVLSATNAVVTIENMLAIMLKRVLKLSTYRIQILLVTYEYLPSLRLCEDQAHVNSLKDVIFNKCLGSLRLIWRPGFRRSKRCLVCLRGSLGEGEICKAQ